MVEMRRVLLVITLASGFAQGACSDAATTTDDQSASSYRTEDGVQIMGEGGSEGEASTRTVGEDNDQGSAGNVYCSEDDQCIAPTPVCRENKCVECIDDSDCGTAKPLCSQHTNICLECLEDGDCEADSICNNGACISNVCTPGLTECDGSVLLTCHETGYGWDAYACPTGLCVDGACAECAPQCGEDQICWQGECVACKPGSKRCEADWVQHCTGTGTWQDSLDCSLQGFVCTDPGYCQSPCGGDPKLNNSNSGCDYWAVDLDNHYAAQNGPFAVIVSNLAAVAATVTVSSKDSATTIPNEFTQRVVQPGGLEIINLPQRHPGGSKIGWFGFRIQSTAQIIAYQFNPLDNVDVFSNDASLLLPVNTFGTEYVVASRDELAGGGPEVGLFETCAFVCAQVEGGQCVDDGSGFGTEVCLVPYRGTMTIIAPHDGTEVTIVPSTDTLGGPWVQAMLEGEEHTFTLEPYQVLNIKSDLTGGDLTGTRITANKPIGVFAGHEASVTSSECCADHLEQQLYPVKTWGKTYVAAKSYTRGVEVDYWRVIASEDMTIISFEPKVANTVALNANQWIEIATDQDFVITADKPVMVAQYIASSQETLQTPQYSPCLNTSDCHPGYTCEMVSVFESVCVPPECIYDGSPIGCPGGHTCACQATSCSCHAIGDPAMILMAPVEQYRKDYVFLTPDKYQDDYVTIVMSLNGTATLDDVELTSDLFQTIPGADYGVARVKVSDGIHKLVTSVPSAVVVHGYDRDVSYGYMAGMNLASLK